MNWDNVKEKIGKLGKRKGDKRTYYKNPLPHYSTTPLLHYSTIKYLLCFLYVGLLLLANNPLVLGARLAGEEGVKSVAPEAEQPAKKPAPVKPAVIREHPKAQERVVPKQKITQGKKVLRKQESDKRYVTIDFDNVDIVLFIKFISELTGKNFVIDKGVRGKVTIISPTKISAKEAYKVFESVLEVHGFTTVPAGNIIKIVPAIHARSKNIETRLREEAISPEDKVITQLIPLDYANPDELKKLFAPLISKNSVIVSYTPTRMLMVTDVLSNIKRLLRIVNAIDIVGIGEEISVIPIEHATASDLSKSFSDIFQARARKRPIKGAPAIPVIRIVADERTNSLIILATEDDAFRVKELVKLLDKPIPRGEGDIHVYYLQNANAEDLAKVLMALPSKEGKLAKKGKAPVLPKEVQIVADKATNSLVITAKKQDYLILEDIIKKLDIPRSMVYLEALIMEVNVDKDFRLGVEWLGMEDFTYHGRKGGFFGGSGGSDDYGSLKGLAGVPPSLPSGFSLGVIGQAITIGDIVFPNLGAILRAYQKDSDVNIISTPQILTTDNEEAEIKVGENVPYITKQETSSADIDYTTYEYKDVGVTLKITPQINQERFVRLKIFQEVIKLKKGTEEYRPTTLKRSAETTVIVKDKNTVVIGGIIGEATERGSYQVPCLGDIPGLGWFFRSISRSRNKTNLFIFITPHIIENPIEARKIYKDKKEEMDRVKEGVIKMYKKPGVINQDSVVK